VIQNSLQRIFDGMVSSVTETVMPHVDDPYARYQLQCLLDLLMNVAERVEWRCADLRRTLDALEPPLRQAVAAGDLTAGLAEELGSLQFRTDAMTNEQLTELRKVHLEALAALQRSDGDRPNPDSDPAQLLARQIAAAALQIQADEYELMRRARIRLNALTKRSGERAKEQQRG
jgi:hypothetical protein